MSQSRTKNNLYHFATLVGISIVWKFASSNAVRVWLKMYIHAPFWKILWQQWETETFSHFYPLGPIDHLLLTINQKF